MQQWMLRENALRLAKQRHEFALKRLEEEQALQLEKSQKKSDENLRKQEIPNWS